MVDEPHAPRQARVQRAVAGRRPVVAGQRSVPVARQLAGVALETVDGRGSLAAEPGDGVEHHPGLAALEQLRAPRREHPGDGRGRPGRCRQRRASAGWPSSSNQRAAAASVAARTSGSGGPATSRTRALRASHDRPGPGVSTTRPRRTRPASAAPAPGGPQRVDQVGREPVEHGQPGQQVPGLGGLGADHLGRQVVVEHPPGRRRRASVAAGRPAGSWARASAASRTAAGHPAGQLVQLGGQAGARSPAARTTAAVSSAGEGEVGGRQVEHLPLAPQPGDGERRVPAGGQHDVQRGRRLPAQAGHEGDGLGGAVDGLDVVEHQHQVPRLALGQRLADPPGVGLGPPALVGAGVGAPGPGHRGHQVGRQPGHPGPQRVGHRPHDHAQGAVTGVRPCQAGRGGAPPTA